MLAYFFRVNLSLNAADLVRKETLWKANRLINILSSDSCERNRINDSFLFSRTVETRFHQRAQVFCFFIKSPRY